MAYLKIVGRDDGNVGWLDTKPDQLTHMHSCQVSFAYRHPKSQQYGKEQTEDDTMTSNAYDH